MDNRGILTVVSGFSGAGKGTLMKRLLEKYDNYSLSISATTRAPRDGEEHGREYFFHSKEEFEELISQDALIEYAQYVENYYGTPKAYVEKQLEAGRDVILEIEIQGALKVKEKNAGYPLDVCNTAYGGGAETPSDRQRNGDTGCYRIQASQSL